MYINLTYDEINYCHTKASEIIANKAGWCKSNQKDMKRKPIDIQTEGVACEMALYKFLGLPFKVEIFRGRDTVDLILKGKYISIKKFCYGWLKIPEHQYNNPELYRYDYVAGVEPLGRGYLGLESFRIVGYISKENFAKNALPHTFHNRKPDGTIEDSKVYYVEEDKLTRFKPREE